MIKQPSQTIHAWLKANLGKRCLAPLTGTDADALTAAVQIIQLYTHSHDPEILKAFRVVVLCMQPKTRHFAYHAIAHVMDWSFRPELWAIAGLDDPIVKVTCEFEPGGLRRDNLP